MCVKEVSFFLPLYLPMFAKYAYVDDENESMLLIFFSILQLSPHHLYKLFHQWFSLLPSVMESVVLAGQLGTTLVEQCSS